MDRKLAALRYLGILGMSLVFFGVAGCTRGKSELPAPTAIPPAPSATPVAGASGPTGTAILTLQVPPTSVIVPVGPTAVVASSSPTPVTAATVAPAPTAVPGVFEYAVQWGDTLYSLALRFNTTVEAIVTANGLPDAGAISAGQVLLIPGTQAQTGSGAGSAYTVQPGDTLFSLALRFGTTVEAIQQANGIVNPSYIHVGQELVIPVAGAGSSQSGSSTYVVRRGDTVYGIAAAYGKSAWDIIVANNLVDPYWIYPGQTLIIP